MKYRSFARVLGLLAIGVLSRPALATTATASFGVSVTVVSGCQASSPSALAYENHAATVAEAASAVAVTCTMPTAYSVVARPAVASQRAAVNQPMVETDTGFSQRDSVGRRAEDESSLGPGTHPDTVFVTISY